MIIKILQQDDWEIWKALRLEALKNSPENFGSAYEEEVGLTDDEWKNRLNKNTVFGGFIEQQLVGSAGFFVCHELKMRHRGMVFGMYTAPQFRKMGIASSLMKEVIEYSKSKVDQLHLFCTSTNIAAFAFYQKYGFKIYGTEPRFLKIDDKFYDVHVMWLDLM